MRNKLFLLSVLATLLVLLTSATGPAQSSVSVDIVNFAFSPATVTVAVGTTITWTNKDDAPHTVTSNSGAFNSGTLQRNKSFQFKFDTAGTFDYHCAIHPFMTAKVVVTAAQQPEEVQEFALIHSLKDLKIYPSTVTVKKGTKVRLFNTATDGSHPTVVISSDEAGTQPLFGVQPFDVEVGQLVVVEFTPDREGEFFITHKTHGHDIVGRLIVQP
jgi:amicyanin